MPKNPKNFNVDNMRVVKIMSGSLLGSKVVQGMVFGREQDGIIKKVSGVKVAVFTCTLDIAQTETKGTALLKNADGMLNFMCSEEQPLERILKEIADSGIRVIIAGSSVGDLALHYLNRFNIVLSKSDLRRVARVVNATPLTRVGTPTPEEASYVDIFEMTEIGGDRVTVLRQLAPGEDGHQSRAEKTRTAAIMLRGAMANHFDYLERAIEAATRMIQTAN
ncbi:chaperonin Cpn60/TCP-1 family [Suillus subalutaceus]|uniref:chaperonin Cpn60/TCP-1 family n=1 Tax=Suillus subalutaceus TaxID=48586 RepID=UPI001B85DF30|nr:chaperonin Cpn60/TCP-1 family [Suillus subalutaceus]KAG1852884.1 chaperonin Cpn60/TCP-1 family [Suillus subalutaceus]